MDVFSQRLEQEYDANVIITSPNVPYKIKWLFYNVEIALEIFRLAYVCKNKPYIYMYILTVKINGEKNIKKYGKGDLEILNPCHVS